MFNKIKAQINDERKWARKRDIKPFIDRKNPDNNIIFTQTEKVSLNSSVPITKNNLIIGNSGKTACFVEPNLLQMNSSYIVTDVGGKLLLKYHKLLSNNGYMIRVLNTEKLYESMHYNPFVYIRENDFKNSIDVLVDAIISNTSSKSKSSDPFWKEMDKTILKACIAIIVCRCDRTEQNLSTLVEMFEMERDIEGSLDPLFMAAKKILENDISLTEIPNGEFIGTREDELYQTGNRLEMYKYATDCYYKYCNNPESVKKSIVLSCLARLAEFGITKEFLEITSYDELQLDKLGDVPTVLFIVPNHCGYSPFVSMVYTQIFDVLLRGANEGNSKYHIHCILDDFANSGIIPNLATAMTTSKGRNLTISICLPCFEQLKTLYSNNFECILSSCGAILLMGMTTAYTIFKVESIIESSNIFYNDLRMLKYGNGKCILFLRTQNGSKAFLSNKYDLLNHKRYYIKEY